MNKNKIIGIVLSIAAIAAVGLFVVQRVQQSRQLAQTSGTQLTDTRYQVTDQQDDLYKSSVLINSKEKENEFGTGYAVGKNTVVTNRHVIQEVKKHPEKAYVRVGHKDKNGKVTFQEFDIKDIVTPKDESIDVAVLHTKPNADGKCVGDYAKPAEYGDSSKIKEGSKLTLVGYPGDKDYGTLWAGTGEVDMADGGMISFRVTSAPGNSGSPLFDESGKVVGMNNAGDTGKSFGFLIDEEIKTFVAENIE